MSPVNAVPHCVIKPKNQRVIDIRVQRIQAHVL